MNQNEFQLWIFLCLKFQTVSIILLIVQQLSTDWHGLCGELLIKTFFVIIVCGLLVLEI